MKEAFGDLDLVLLMGDLNGHHTAMGTPDEPMDEDATYSLLLSQHAGINQILTENLSDTMVLPTFGNNDSKYHDNPQPVNDSSFFYNYIHELWFELLPSNMNLLSDDNKDQIKETFRQGGYYRVDVTDEISVISLNTLFYDFESVEHYAAPEDEQQLEWLDEQLREDSDRKFIIICHVYPGARYGTQQMWFDGYSSAYFAMLEMYRDRIIIEVAGHDHFADVRYKQSESTLSEDSYFYHNIFVTPGVTPVYGSNPGVAFLEIDDELKPTNLRQSNLNLQATLDKPI
jgi:hypothetical protein